MGSSSCQSRMDEWCWTWEGHVGLCREVRGVATCWEWWMERSAVWGPWEGLSTRFTANEAAEICHPHSLVCYLSEQGTGSHLCSAGSHPHSLL